MRKYSEISTTRILFTILAAVSFAVFLYIAATTLIRQAQPTQITNKKDTYSLSLGNVVFTVDATQYSVIDPVTRNSIVPNVSNIQEGSKVPEIGNVYTATLPLQNAGTGQPHLHIYVWDENAITFQSLDTEKKYNEHMSILKNLQTYRGTEKFPFKDQQSVYFDLNRFTSQGGSYNHPLFVEKIDDSRFDSAFYVESIAGNGMYAPETTKNLILHSDSLWIVFTKTPDEFSDFSCNKSSSSQQLLCAVDIWRQTSTKKADKEWVDTILHNIHLQKSSI